MIETQQQPQRTEQTEPNSPEPAPTPKTEAQLRKQKKKKQKALTQFLSKAQNEVIQVPRKIEEEAKEEPTQITNCRICGDLSEKKKKCQFCKENVCSEHVRKKRKNKETGKFVKICDQCQDKFLYDKHLSLQSKADQAILMQELIVQGKHDQLAELVASKQTKIAVLKSKKKELEQDKKRQDHRHRIEDNDLHSKQKKFEYKTIQLDALAKEIVKLEESLPRPLDDDYNCLVDQNNKITKELVKYQKLCSEALKAKSTREKELMELYDRWQKRQTVKTVKKAGKGKNKDDCLIY